MLKLDGVQDNECEKYDIKKKRVMDTDVQYILDDTV